MSTLKVTNIESPSGGGVSAKINDIGGGQLSNRNLVINGAMQVAQRGTTFAGSQVAAYRTCDRFVSNVFQLGTWTINQRTGGFGDTWEAGATERFRASFEHICTTADASPQTTDNVRVIQYIEGQNLQHLNYGQATAKQLTLSFWVKSNKTGAASFEINQPDNSNRMFSTSYTINAADTWEKKVINIPADTAGVIDNNNDRGLMLQWWLNSGPSFTGGAHSSTWVAQSDTARNSTNLGVGGAVNDNWSITGVQLEVGNLATSFEHRSYGDELQRCMRYYQEYTSSTNGLGIAGAGYVETGTQTEFSFFLSTPMRTLASANIIEIGDLEVRIGGSRFDVTGLTSVAFNDKFSLATTRVTNVNSGASVGTVARLRSDGVGAGFSFNAEL
jgi:hypothetical protein